LPIIKELIDSVSHTAPSLPQFQLSLGLSIDNKHAATVQSLLSQFTQLNANPNKSEIM